jgi:type IV pilus assembly protein PilV
MSMPCSRQLKYLKQPVGRRFQNGVMLLEALIAVLIFSVGLLAVIALQAVAHRELMLSKLRSDASYIADRVMGDLSARDIAGVLDGETTYSAVSNAAHAWAKAVTDTKSGLPGGTVNVVKIGSSVTVTVSWVTPDGPHRFSQTANLVDS